MNVPCIHALFVCSLVDCASEQSYPAKMIYLIPKNWLGDWELKDRQFAVASSPHVITGSELKDDSVWLCQGCLEDGEVLAYLDEGEEEWEWRRQPTLEEYIKAHGWDKAVKL